MIERLMKYFVQLERRMKRPMNVKDLIAQMTLEEKIDLCSGVDFWHLKGIERLGIPSVMVSDGPHGLRKQAEKSDNLGINDSIQAVCFPTAAGTAGSFDRALLRRLGETLGEECQAENVAILLGPAVNIKRSPLCGRNFEYFSEDPYLAGEMAASYISGVQSKHVGTSIKHFAVNNQERRRMTVSAVTDERTLREIYFPAFETAVKKAQPWTVMCSYNRINGVYSSENEWLLEQVLRKDWGFQGFVMTDWGAANDRLEGIKAGLELEMPSSGGVNSARIRKGFQEGRISEEALDRAAERILAVILRYAENRDETAVFDREADHEKARQAARETMVLLKNDGALPLRREQKIAFIGGFAEKPRYQGGGSSHINAYRVVGALEAVKGKAEVAFAKGFDSEGDTLDETLLREAVEAAKAAQVAVIFAGLPDSFESEGFDRKHLNLPRCQNRVIEAVCRVQPNTVVVLHNGSPVLMPWLGGVNAVLESYLGGEAVGQAQVDLLFGEANPCAKLAETFPLSLEDTPCAKYFPGGPLTVEYRESIYVGYRYYDKAEMGVLFPFGHGLSYTQFAYSDLKLDKTRFKAEKGLTVSFKIRNTGERDGAEVAQVYVADVESSVFKAPKELKGFEKVFLKAGEEKTVELTLDERAFAYYDTAAQGWRAESGKYQILVGASSRDIRLSGNVQVLGAPVPKGVPEAQTLLPTYYNGHFSRIPDAEFEALLGRPIPRSWRDPKQPFTRDNTIDDAKNTKWGRRIMKLIRRFVKMDGISTDEMAVAMIAEMPVHNLSTMSQGAVTQEMEEAIVMLFNDEKPAKAFGILIAGVGNAIKKAKQLL